MLLGPPVVDTCTPVKPTCRRAREGEGLGLR